MKEYLSKRIAAESGCGWAPYITADNLYLSTENCPFLFGINSCQDGDYKDVNIIWQIF